MTDKIHPPWTAEQVTALNRFQREGGMHPFTCGSEHPQGSPILEARRDGWHCPTGCGYWQGWAHAFMTDQTTQGGLYGPQSAPDDSTDAGAATEAGDGRVAGWAEAVRRERYAAAVLDRIKACTFPSPIPGQPPTFGATEHDIANAAMDVADEELEQLRAENERLRAQQAGFFAQMAAARQQNRDWCQRAQTAERALERARAEGWREAARFLRRTPRDSADFPGALRGARLIEDELSAVLEGQQQEEQ